MGEILDPKPPQWQREQPLEDVAEDRVLLLADRLMRTLTDGELDSTLVQVTSLMLLLKATVGNYRSIVGKEAANELSRQASEMLAYYRINGVDDSSDE